MISGKVMASTRLILMLAMFGALTAPALADNPPGPDNLVMLVDRATVQGGTGTHGSFTYDAGQNCIWIGIYGSGQGFRRYDLNTNTVAQYVIQDDMDRFCRASNVPGGVTWAGDGGAQRCFGLLLNKTTLNITSPAPANQPGPNITLTYPPGTLLFSTDQPTAVSQGGSTFKGEWTKMIFRYDKRKIYDPINLADPWAGQLNYDNAQNGAGSVMGSFLTVDWNDVFTVVCNDQQFLTAAGVLGAQVPTTGRQATWSHDGKSLYWNASDSTFGGIYKVHAETGTVQYIYVSKGGTPTLNTELGVVHTSVWDFDPNNPTVGDQIIFRGTGNAGNPYGMSYILDDGAAVTGPFVLMTKTQFDKWMQFNGKLFLRNQTTGGDDPGVYTIHATSPDTWSMTADSDGTLYFTDNATQGGLWKLDPQRRLVGFRSAAQMVRWYRSIDPNSTTTSKQMLRPQLRQTTFAGPSGNINIKQLLFRDNGLGGVGATNIFKPGDFNRDDVVDATDFALLEAAMVTPVATFTSGTAPSLRFYEAPADINGVELETVDVQAYVDYLKYDLNNNGLVTPKDRQILGRFVGKAICDYDWDGDVDMDDFGHFQSCYTNGPLSPLGMIRCDDADLTGDGRSDVADFTIFQSCASRANVPADVNCGL